MATMKTLNADRAPMVQGGIESDLNGRKSVKWVGRASELVEGHRRIKLVPGFQPEEYVVSAWPLTDPVGVHDTGADLDESHTLSVSFRQQQLNDDGVSYADVEGGYASAEAVVANGPLADHPGVQGTGVSANAPLVTDDRQFVEISVSGAKLDRDAGLDALIEVRIYQKQVDPAPKKMH